MLPALEGAGGGAAPAAAPPARVGPNLPKGGYIRLFSRRTNRTQDAKVYSHQSGAGKGALSTNQGQAKEPSLNLQASEVALDE